MSRFFRSLVPLALSLLGALIVAGILIGATGANPLTSLGTLDTGATGLGAGGFQPQLLAQTLARVTPLLLIGLAVALALRGGMFNIGAQGQMILGALAAALVGVRFAHAATGPTGSAPLLTLLLLIVGAATGALWAAVPAYLRTARGVHEVITTIFFNYIAVNVADYLVTYHFKDRGSQTVQTLPIAHGAILTPWVPGSNLTSGILIALACAALYTWGLRQTALGFQIRAVGVGPDAARAAGIPVARTQILAMALSGALAGLAGALEVVSVEHRFLSGLAGTNGFDGIAVAFLGGASGIGIALSALLFGGLLSGARYLQMMTSVPSAIAVVLQAVLIVGAAAKWPGLPSFARSRFANQTRAAEREGSV